jgi:hypothetical protein
MAFRDKSTNVYESALVFAAAAAAFRIQHLKYVKSSEYYFDKSLNQALKKRSNVECLKEFLVTPENILDKDREFGEKIRSYYQSLSFKLLAGKNLSDIEFKGIALATGDSVKTNELGLVAYFPAGYETAIQRKQVEEKLSEVDSKSLGKEGDRITVTGRVIRSFYSKNYNVYFITVVTENNQAVSCSSKTDLKEKLVTVTGKIKGFREGVAQLSYPKISLK